MDVTVDTSELRQIKNNFLFKIFGNPDICHNQFELTPFLDKTIPLLHSFCMVESGFIISIIAKSYSKSVNDLDELVQNMLQNVDDMEKTQHRTQQQSVLTKKRKMTNSKAKQTTVQFSMLEPKNLTCLPKSKLMESYQNANCNDSHVNINNTNDDNSDNEIIELNESTKHCKDDGKLIKKTNKFKRSFYISILQKNSLSHSTDDNEIIVDDRGNNDNRQKYCLFTNYIDEHNLSLRNENGYFNNVINTINKTQNNNNNNTNNNAEDKLNMYRTKPFHVYSFKSDMEKTTDLKLHSSEYLNRVRYEQIIEKIVLLKNHELRSYTNGKEIDFMLHVLNNINDVDVDVIERDSGNESVSDLNDLNNIEVNIEDNTKVDETVNLENVNVCDYDMEYDDEKYRIPTNTGVTGTTIELPNSVKFCIPPLEKNILINNFPFVDDTKLLYTSSLKVCDWMALLPNIALVPAQPPFKAQLSKDIFGIKNALKRKQVFNLTDKMIREFRKAKRARMDDIEEPFFGYPPVKPFEPLGHNSQLGTTCEWCTVFRSKCKEFLDAQNAKKKKKILESLKVLPTVSGGSVSMVNSSLASNEISADISTQILTVDSTMESTQNGPDNSMVNADQSTAANLTNESVNTTQVDMSADGTINDSQLKSPIVTPVSNVNESNTNGYDGNSNVDDENCDYGEFSIDEACSLPVVLLVAYLKVNPIPIDIQKLQIYVFRDIKAFAPVCLSLAQLQNKHVQYTVALTFFAVLHLANKRAVSIINLSSEGTLAEAKDVYIELINPEANVNMDLNDEFH